MLKAIIERQTDHYRERADRLKTLRAEMTSIRLMRLIRNFQPPDETFGMLSLANNLRFMTEAVARSAGAMRRLAWHLRQLV